jgi:hypothetical protein
MEANVRTTLLLLFVGIALFSTAPASRAQSFVGDWQGDLTPQLSVVLHVAAERKAYKATADSPRQGAFGMPATFTVNGNNVSFTIAVPNNPASFTGTANGNTISGTFHQGGSQVPLTLTKSAPGASAGGGAGFAGDWKGDLTPQLSVVLHVATDGNGYKATADSPKQGAFGMPATFTANGKNVSFTIAVPNNPASFAGTANGNAISGTFRQGGGQLPLTLTK